MMEKIIILPCNGDSASGEITRLATQELVLLGKGELGVSFRQIREILKTRSGKTVPIIIVDGCERRCLSNKLQEKRLICRHQLALTDVGIEPACLEDITRDDIELAKNAIIAECRPVSKVMPVPFSGCCCR